MIRLQFWKMHGLGNDFIVIDNRDGKATSAEAAGDLARRLCDRHTSVGADGILLLSNSSIAEVGMQILNADGSEAEMCGNGVRCLARYCYENSIVRKTEFVVDTLAGPKRVWLKVEDNRVREVGVDMGTVEWDREKIPMVGGGTCLDCLLHVGEVSYRITCLSMGNPHCVIFVKNVDKFPVKQVGPLIENNEAFPNRINVEFVQLLGRGELKVRVWERGCGETLACGTGACASVAAANRLGLVESKVKVHLTGGDLLIEAGKHMLMTGPAERVFEGVLF